MTLAVSVVFAFQASNVTVQTPRLNESLGAVVGPTTAALRRLQSQGKRGPYLVTWLPDAEAIGSAGFGLLNELLRGGFDVRAEEAFRPGATRYHVIDRPPTDARGPPRDGSRYRELACGSPLQRSGVVRSSIGSERTRFDTLRADVIGSLRSDSLGALVPQVDNNLFMLALAPRVPATHADDDLADARLEYADGGLRRTGGEDGPALTMLSLRARRDERWFQPVLALVVVGALALRVVYVFAYRRDFDPHGDAYFYHAGANLLAQGKGFISPFFVQLGLKRAAAEHPPLYTIFLAIPSVLGMKSVLTHLLWSCLLGSATVGLIGLVGRAVGGVRVGIIAAAVAAVYPNLWAPDGMLQAETLSMFAAATTILLPRTSTGANQVGVASCSSARHARSVRSPDPS